jgi:hypothetical protein
VLFLLNDRVMDTVTGELATVTWSSSNTFDVWYDKDNSPSQGWGQSTNRFKKITEVESVPALQVSSKN